MDSRDRRRDDRRRREKDEERGHGEKRSRYEDDGRRRREDSRSRTRSRERKKESRRDKSKERKERKEEKKRQKEAEQIRQLAELSVYNPVDNPFHDANLNQQFKWHKKSEKEKKSGLSAAEAQARDMARRQEAKEELERLNRRRAEREAEMELREEEEAKMARLQESAQMAEWIAKEGDFQLEQERKRSIIRLKERRAKAIDFLSLNLKYAHPQDEEEDDGLDAAGLDIDLDEPYNILDNLNLAQTEELHDDIQRYLRLEETDVHIDFWTNMMVVCKARLDDLRQQASEGRRGGPSNGGVESSISALLSDKNYDQLVELQRSIQAKLSSGDPIDVDYWEGLLKSLLVWKAKAKLKALHEVVVRNRLEQLRKRQRDEAIQAQVELLGKAAIESTKQWPAEVRPLPSQQEEDEAMEIDEVEPYTRDMTPPLFEPGRLSYEDRQLQIVDPLEELKALMELRRSVAATRFVPKAIEEEAAEEVITEKPVVIDAFTRELNYRMDAEADLEEDDEEELFNVEASLANPVTYTWEDKYRPRKPRYLNRVHTGYEWNKYNQTHYDTDNPPPKVVQGYKFNIFYPDLIDKSKAPTYKLIKQGPNEDTILLLFTAGPPYEDIAFQIVNRDWEHSHKRGFRSTFDRGCLSLWFNFRRNFYRK